MITVTLKNDSQKHWSTQKVFDDAVVLVRQALNQADCLDGVGPSLRPLGMPDANYRLHPNRQVRWVKGNPGDVQVREVRGGSLRVRVKTGDNSTTWDYDLIPPATISPEDVRHSLLRVTVSEDDPEPAINGHAPPRAADVPVAAEPQRQSSMSDTLKGMMQTIERSEQRASLIERLNSDLSAAVASIDKLEAQKKAVIATKARIESELLALMQEEEQDEDFKVVSQFMQKMIDRRGASVTKQNG